MVNMRMYSVTDVNNYIKHLLDSIPELGDLYIKGELSNYKLYPSGHHYFTLKDETGTLKAVMFRGEASKLVFRPENGMKVIVRGSISVYPRDGVYQLYAKEMIPDGVGALYIAYEQLKEKLSKLGLFEESRKRPLPKYPGQICLVTSSAGAAVRDMLRILKKRFPLAAVRLLPVRVQGDEAPGEIVAAIDYANLHKLGDLIITGRGGGSIEDLWAFNDEQVAYAIFRSEIPVISAVGHEPDFTIADFVADCRAATPSNAAELAVPDMQDLKLRLRTTETRLLSLQRQRILHARQRLRALSERKVLQSPLQYILDRRLQLDSVQNRFEGVSRQYLSLKRERFVRLAAKLDAMSPLKVLARGYAIASLESGKVLIRAKDVAIGDSVSLLLSEGVVQCSVKEIFE